MSYFSWKCLVTLIITHKDRIFMTAHYSIEKVLKSFNICHKAPQIHKLHLMSFTNQVSDCFSHKCLFNFLWNCLCTSSCLINELCRVFGTFMAVNEETCRKIVSGSMQRKFIFHVGPFIKNGWKALRVIHFKVKRYENFWWMELRKIKIYTQKAFVIGKEAYVLI